MEHTGIVSLCLFFISCYLDQRVIQLGEHEGVKLPDCPEMALIFFESHQPATSRALLCVIARAHLTLELIGIFFQNVIFFIILFPVTEILLNDIGKMQRIFSI